MKDQKKSPIVALAWAVGLPGFGQIYNRDYVWALVLMAWELYVNLQAEINLSLYYTIQLDFEQAHDIVNFEWGLFYPSVYAFSMWQAYNQARVLNGKQGMDLTGFFVGSVVGMVIGITLYFSWTMHTPFASPVISGILLGLIAGFIGHLIEKRFVRKRTDY
ncbi:hypothetical protein GCM10028778_16340 [Barrientosiimonas marina]|uniref:DUF5683 domain-containing protein n=1 Tax=Lentibacillus kimchii TaxID=1542911 RepID=A0ABW2UX87_9BACI